MSKWAEIRNDFVCEDSHKIYIDAWLTADDNEEGVVIARIDMDTKKIEYFDDAAKTDGYAQEIIKETIEELSKHGESRKDSSSRQKGEEMAKFYFTYGTSEQYPFRGGWSEIHAPDLCAATQIFKAYHPNPYGDCVLNCADYYTEEEFHENDIFISGNLGAFCHEVIRPTAMSGKVIADVAPKRMSEELQAVLNLAQFIETEFQEDTPATGFQHTVD